MNDAKSESRKPVIVLAGPTAAGKTELSLRLAEEINGSVVSADSMQVYRGMDIGTAKLAEKERRGIPHYLIDVLEPEEDFNVYMFQRMAKEAMRDIWDKGRIPILTGGTGFYIQAVLRDIDFTENDGKSDLRAKLENLALEKGPEYVHGILRSVDSEAAEAIHPNNLKRVIRAIEFHEQTGGKISVHNREESEKESPYLYLYFVLNEDRRLLYENIEKRVDEMIRDGLVEEAEKLVRRGLTERNTSMKGLGYREMFPYFRGECTLDEAVENIKKDTRHFAKRQITWFKREPCAVWINKEDFDFDDEQILNYMLMLWNVKKGMK